MSDIPVRPVRDDDARSVCEIYNHYVRDTTVTFEESAVSAREFQARMRAVAGAGLPWLVAERDSKLVGYAYATPWRARAAYRFSVEVSVYVAPDCGRSGVGTALYEPLFSRLEALGRNAVIGGITLPNPASVAFHERFGMHKVAHFENVGYKFGRWLDVGYWQRSLQRPSAAESPR